MILKKIGALSLGYAAAVILFIAGLLNAILLIIQANMPMLANQMDANVVVAISEGWIKLLIFTPLISLITGFIGGLILAVIYNYVIVKIVGGIKLELK